MYAVYNKDRIHHLMNESKMLIFTYNIDRKMYHTMFLSPYQLNKMFIGINFFLYLIARQYNFIQIRKLYILCYFRRFEFKVSKGSVTPEIKGCM